MYSHNTIPSSVGNAECTHMVQVLSSVGNADFIQMVQVLVLANAENIHTSPIPSSVSNADCIHMVPFSVGMLNTLKWY